MHPSEPILPASQAELAKRFPLSLGPAKFRKIRNLAERLNKIGGKALLVGGAVRDTLLEEAVDDLDVEVFGLKPDVLEKELRRFHAVDCVGRAFGVFKLRNTSIDVTIPRRESQIGSGHRDFKVDGDPDMTIEDAALRRDFTLNAISWNPLTEELIDPYNGVRDLHDRVLRHVSGKFAEDPLRVLRGMQFIARFRLTPCEETLKLCQGLTQDDLPTERIFEEWSKLLLKGTAISDALNFLVATRWIRFYPELEALIDCKQEPKWHPEGDVWTHTGHCLDHFASHRIGDPWEDLVVGLAVLCHDIGKPKTTFADTDGRIRSPRHDIEGVAIAEQFLNRFTRQHAIFDAVLPLVREHMRPHDLYTNHAGANAIRRLAHRVGRIDRLVRVAAADHGGRPPLSSNTYPAGQWLLAEADKLAVKDSAPQPLLQGRHLIELGAQPGPHFKAILEAAFQAQLDGQFCDEDGAKLFALERLGPRPDTETCD